MTNPQVEDQLLKETMTLYLHNVLDLKECEATMLKIHKLFKSFKGFEEINELIDLYFKSKHSRQIIYSEPMEKYDEAIKLIQYLKDKIKDEELLKSIENFENIKEYKGW